MFGLLFQVEKNVFFVTHKLGCDLIENVLVNLFICFHRQELNSKESEVQMFQMDACLTGGYFVAQKERRALHCAVVAADYASILYCIADRHLTL